MRMIIPTKGTDNDWISISDLMSVLMMIFIFIAISYIQNVQTNQKRIKQIAVTYQQLQQELYDDLSDEFRKDLKRWNAEINRENLSIKFKEPDVLFEIGKSSVKDRFREILADFFPRYISILYSQKYRDNIEEIRVEGHTSSEWSGVDNLENKYFLNMELSQGRTRSVLQFCLDTITSDAVKTWVIKNTTANGLSFSRPVCDINGCEDAENSRRVEFRTRTNAERRIVSIIETLNREE